jgi:hypothetical protein
VVAASAARRPARGARGARAHRTGPDRVRRAALSGSRDWLGIDGFERLLEELPDVRTGLGRTERSILEALSAQPLTPHELFAAVAAREDPPRLGDTAVFALAADLEPLVRLAGGRYELTPEGTAVLSGAATRPPIDRWLGGVHLRPGHPDWAWDATAHRPIRLD